MPGRQANTTALIGAWSMDGAHGDLDGFRPAPDIVALVAERDAVEIEEALPPERPPLLFKTADEDDWQLFPVAVPEPA